MNDISAEIPSHLVKHSLALGIATEILFAPQVQKD